MRYKNILVPSMDFPEKTENSGSNSLFYHIIIRILTCTRFLNLYKSAKIKKKSKCENFRLFT